MIWAPALIRAPGPVRRAALSIAELISEARLTSFAPSRLDVVQRRAVPSADAEIRSSPVGENAKSWTVPSCSPMFARQACVSGSHRQMRLSLAPDAKREDVGEKQ